MTTNEQRIRDFAYQIWESEGCPAGQEERHWEMAAKLVEAETAATQRTPVKAARKAKSPALDGLAATPSPRKKASRDEPAEEKAALLKPPKKTSKLASVSKSTE